jgi:hypothetical protein
MTDAPATVKTLACDDTHRVEHYLIRFLTPRRLNEHFHALICEPHVGEG